MARKHKCCGRKFKTEDALKSHKLDKHPVPKRQLGFFGAFAAVVLGGIAVLGLQNAAPIAVSYAQGFDATPTVVKAVMAKR